MQFKSVFIAAAACLAISGQVQAQTEVLYITDGDANDITAIQGGAIIDQNLDVGGDRRYRVAVQDTIWLGDMDAADNIELDLNLDPTGNSSPAGLDITEGTDGATDGSFNYTVESFVSTAGVYQYNTDWSGGTLLFTVSGTDIVGITYDPVNGSLWISDQNSIYEYSMAGNLIGQFDHSGGRGSLAYEASTDTLWYVANAGSTIQQYDKAGNLLDTLSVSYGGNYWGAEMAAAAAPPPPTEPPAPAVPVPSMGVPGIALLALLMMIVGLGFTRIRGV